MRPAPSSSSTCRALTPPVILFSLAGILTVPKNQKIVALPLFELYDNAVRCVPPLAARPRRVAGADDRSPAAQVRPAAVVAPGPPLARQLRLRVLSVTPRRRAYTHPPSTLCTASRACLLCFLSIPPLPSSFDRASASRVFCKHSASATRARCAAGESESEQGFGGKGRDSERVSDKTSCAAFCSGFSSAQGPKRKPRALVHRRVEPCGGARRSSTHPPGSPFSPPRPTTLGFAPAARARAHRPTHAATHTSHPLPPTRLERTSSLSPLPSRRHHRTNNPPARPRLAPRWRPFTSRCSTTRPCS